MQSRTEAVVGMKNGGEILARWVLMEMGQTTVLRVDGEGMGP